MPLTSPIRGYDPDWPSRYRREALALRPIFGAALAGLHHVGSTAVPGLAAKPEIDVLIVLGARPPEGWGGRLGARGYRRGTDLSPGHRFLKRDVAGLRTHKLHVCDDGHPEIARMLSIRDHLRRHEADRLAYQALKLDLERRNRTGMAEYLDGKAPFLDALAARLRPDP